MGAHATARQRPIESLQNVRVDELQQPTPGDSSLMHSPAEAEPSRLAVSPSHSARTTLLLTPGIAEELQILELADALDDQQ